MTDFTSRHLTETQRQMDIDLAELRASLATLAGADRTVSSATAVIVALEVAGRAPLLQPLALRPPPATRSHSTRTAGENPSRQPRADGSADHTWPRIQRVRPQPC